MNCNLLCRCCNHEFGFDLAKSDTLPNVCPHCKTAFDSYEARTAEEFLDKIISYNERFTSLRIIQVSESIAEGKGNAETDSTIFLSDIQNIKQLYDCATDEGKTLLTSVIDKLYLLLNRDRREKPERLQSTQRVYELLNQEFLSFIDARNKETAEILGIDL